MIEIAITKVDHDSWWGYYIGEELYGYSDYYNFSDDEVELEAILRAIEAGRAKKRSDVTVILEYHHDWDVRDELFDEAADEFSSTLPETLTEFKQWFVDRA